MPRSRRTRTRAELAAKHAAVPAHVRALCDALLRAALDRLLRERREKAQPRTAA